MSRDLLIRAAKVYLNEAKRRRGQPFHAVLLQWAANSRKRASKQVMQEGQMELFV